MRQVQIRNSPPTVPCATQIAQKTMSEEFALFHALLFRCLLQTKNIMFQHEDPAMSDNQDEDFTLELKV
jgi:hypothetical protein